MAKKSKQNKKVDFSNSLVLPNTFNGNLAPIFASQINNGFTMPFKDKEYRQSLMNPDPMILDSTNPEKVYSYGDYADANSYEEQLKNKRPPELSINKPPVDYSTGSRQVMYGSDVDYNKNGIPDWQEFEQAFVNANIGNKNIDAVLDMYTNRDALLNLRGQAYAYLNHLDEQYLRYNPSENKFEPLDKKIANRPNFNITRYVVDGVNKRLEAMDAADAGQTRSTLESSIQNVESEANALYAYANDYLNAKDLSKRWQYYLDGMTKIKSPISPTAIQNAEVAFKNEKTKFDLFNNYKAKIGQYANADTDWLWSFVIAYNNKLLSNPGRLTYMQQENLKKNIVVAEANLKNKASTQASSMDVNSIVNEALKGGK